MSEWRLGHGWTDRELEERLERARTLPLSFNERYDQMTPERGWNQYHSEAVIARERPGAPVPDGAFERACELINDYAFSDPKIVTAHFAPKSILLNRPLLLEIQVLRIHFISGVRITKVRSERGRHKSVYGFRYDTLEGHLECGAEWFLLTKHHDTGEVWFRIEAAWKRGQLPTWWAELGFPLFVRPYQRRWHRRAYLRMRAVLGSEQRPPLPRNRRLVHYGPRAAPAATLRALPDHLRDLPREHEEIVPELPQLTREPLLESAALGAITGLRSMLGPAVVGHHLTREHGNGRLAHALGSPRGATLTKVLAAGELLADKSGFVPARVQPLPLAVRAVNAATCGALVGGRAHAAVASACAVAAAVAGFRLRRRASAAGLPDVVAGLAEDALALAAGGLVLRSLRRHTAAPAT